MGLSGQQRKELQDALMDAFPDKSSLGSPTENLDKTAQPWKTRG